MIIKNKWIAILLTISGVMVALSNVYLFLNERTAWQGVMILVGIGWIWIGVSNLRRLQHADPSDK